MSNANTNDIDVDVDEETSTFTVVKAAKRGAVTKLTVEQTAELYGNLTQDEANEIGKNFWDLIGYKNEHYAPGKMVPARGGQPCYFDQTEDGCNKPSDECTCMHGVSLSYYIPCMPPWLSNTRDLCADFYLNSLCQTDRCPHEHNTNITMGRFKRAFPAEAWPGDDVIAECEYKPLRAPPANRPRRIEKAPAPVDPSSYVAKARASLGEALVAPRPAAKAPAPTRPVPPVPVMVQQPAPVSIPTPLYNSGLPESRTSDNVRGLYENPQRYAQAPQQQHVNNAAIIAQLDALAAMISAIRQQLV